MMDVFLKRLKEYNSRSKKRSWILVLDDQLSDEIGPLSREDPHELGILLIESHWKMRRRPYHKQRIAFQLLNLRHFALEQADRGITVRYVTSAKPYSTTLKPLIRELGAMRVMEPAEYEVRQDLKPLLGKGLLRFVPHEGWLTLKEDFLKGAGAKPPWRMDAFYRYVRQKTGILMKGNKPIGGKYSFDADNRESWNGEPVPPRPPSFSRDPIKDELLEWIEQSFADHPGSVQAEALAGTKSDAVRQWMWAKQECLPHFGPFEDAMAQQEPGLFHTRISALVNIHRLLPQQIISDVQKMTLSISSKEGFIRQVLGWREFVRHVHRETEGFRRGSDADQKPGDAGYAEWKAGKWKASRNPSGLDGGARPSFLGAKDPLPPVFWGNASGLNCLDRVVRDVWDEAYSHHITRLMILSNIATLLDVSPRELTDWFWVAYTDAFDWVVEPNVLAMGTFGTGPLMTTKPYVSGAAYIDRMSDYCQSCAFDPKANCPITRLYWAFLARHHSKLTAIPRLRLPLNNLKKRSQAHKQTDSHAFKVLRHALKDDEIVTPDHFKTRSGDP